MVGTHDAQDVHRSIGGVSSPTKQQAEHQSKVQTHPVCMRPASVLNLREAWNRVLDLPAVVIDREPIKNGAGFGAHLQGAIDACAKSGGGACFARDNTKLVRFHTGDTAFARMGSWHAITGVSASLGTALQEEVCCKGIHAHKSHHRRSGLSPSAARHVQSSSWRARTVCVQTIQFSCAELSLSLI